MRSGRRGAAGSATETSGTDSSSITESDDPLKERPGPPAGPGAPDGAREPGVSGAAEAGHDTEDGAEPLTESDAEEQVHGICFKTGPPGRVGVELEWLVFD